MLSAATSTFMLWMGWRKSWLAAARNWVLVRWASLSLSRACFSWALSRLSAKRMRHESSNTRYCCLATPTRNARKMRISTPSPAAVAADSLGCALSTQARASGTSMGAPKARKTLR